MSPSAKDELILLMDTLLPFAQKLLEEHGEFHPFGGTIDTTGQKGMTGGWTGDEHPPSIDVIDVIHKGFVKDAKEGKLVATALLYDVRVVPPGQTAKTDAIAVDVDHRDGISQTVIYPYQLQKGRLMVGQPYAIELQHPVFTH